MNRVSYGGTLLLAIILLSMNIHAQEIPLPAIIRWSKTWISIIFPASTIFFVMAISSLLGSGLPLGWLWIRIILADEHSIATLNTSRGWTMLEFKLPVDIVSCLIILFAELRHTTINFSFTSSIRMGINKFATSSGDVILASLDHLDCESTRRLISKAASNVAALSFPIPAF